jgi:hypothetical protein
MDFETLYDMAASAARNAERMCSQEGGPGNGLPFQNYAGYTAYIDEYNRLLALTSHLDPEVTTFTPLIDLGKGRNPSDAGDAGRTTWRTTARPSSPRPGFAASGPASGRLRRN